jgi:anti-sigma regulatory factor (Ser/Thr protein kinase)
LQLFGIEAAGAVELAITEAVGNAALHAYPLDEPGEIEVVVNVDQNRVEAVIRDHGVGPLPSASTHQGGRYGVVLMKALADRFDLDATPGEGTTVRMEFARPSP